MNVPADTRSGTLARLPALQARAGPPLPGQPGRTALSLWEVDKSTASRSAGAVHLNHMVAAYGAVPQLRVSPRSWLAPELSTVDALPVCRTCALVRSSFAGLTADALSPILPWSKPLEPTWTR